ncbi:hypothetical protein GZH53_05635 [Flavihumibacter sp. R14]|nr:hypothetical protein [Flavihumibacter soli]
MKTKDNYLLKLWGMPVFIAVLTIIGLLLAIVGTGLWHFFSWVALCIPLYIMIRFGKRCFK